MWVNYNYGHVHEYIYIYLRVYIYTNTYKVCETSMLMAWFRIRNDNLVEIIFAVFRSSEPDYF